MVNKKLIALLVTILTVSASMFAFLGDVLRETVEAPATVVTGETAKERHERLEAEKADRKAARRQRKEAEDRFRPEEERAYSSRYYAGATE